MPIGRYIAWVGASLLALLFIAGWCLPDPSPEPGGGPIERPVIRIASVQQPPELVVIDTSLPTIVPPPTPVEPIATSEPATSEPTPARSLAFAPPPQTAVDTDRKTRKANKRQAPKVATIQPRLEPAPAPVGPAASAPRTKLSFADILSGQLVKNLFNLR
ncbi:hypothetical protein ACFFWD_13960 [Bradyrhizobium erythrophlei]|uniref:hypothetical protein n=1 Tax=Bradyrhizobium erythrophlei TaxID=1437360 RepID=UPI0035EF5DE9